MKKIKNILMTLLRVAIFSIIFVVVFTLVMMLSNGSFVCVFLFLLFIPFLTSRHHKNKTAIIIMTYTSIILVCLSMFIWNTNIAVNIEVLNLNYSLNSNIQDIKMLMDGREWNSDHFLIENLDLIAKVLRDSTKITTDIFKYIISIIMGTVGFLIWFVSLIWSIKK